MSEKIVKILDKKADINKRYEAFKKFEELTHDINYQYLDLKDSEMDTVDFIVKYGFLPEFKVNEYFESRKEITKLEIKKKEYQNKINELREFLYKEKEKNIINLDFCILYTKYKLLLKYKDTIVDEEANFFSKLFTKTKKIPKNEYVLKLFLRSNGKEFLSKKAINEKIHKFQEEVHEFVFSKKTKGMSKSLNMEKYLTPKSNKIYNEIKDILFQYEMVNEKNFFDFNSENVNKETVFVEELKQQYIKILKQKEKIVVDNIEKAIKNINKIKKALKKLEEEIPESVKERIIKEAEFILLFEEYNNEKSIFEKSVIRYGEL
tara:strand:+ start:967 stop:1926 length:960 start_codon:yes stop_codon:yes gene_type:complete